MSADAAAGERRSRDLSRGVLARVLLVVAAAAAIFWLATWLHDQRLLEQARRVGITAHTPGQIRTAISLLERAGQRTPDSLPEAGRAIMLMRAGDNARAAALMESILRREPRNVAVWALLGQADPRRAAQARARVRKLSPLPAPSG